MPHRTYTINRGSTLTKFLEEKNLTSSYKIVYNDKLAINVAIPIVSEKCYKLSHLLYTNKNNNIETYIDSIENVLGKLPNCKEDEDDSGLVLCSPPQCVGNHLTKCKSSNYCFNNVCQSIGTTVKSPDGDSNCDGKILECKPKSPPTPPPLPKKCFQYIDKPTCTGTSTGGSGEQYMSNTDSCIWDGSACCSSELHNGNKCQNPALVGNWYYQYGQICDWVISKGDGEAVCSSGCYSDTDLGKIYKNNKPTTILLESYLDNSGTNAAFYLGNGYIAGKEFDKTFGSWKTTAGAPWIKRPKSSKQGPFDTYPYQIINFGGWGCCIGEPGCEAKDKPSIQRATMCKTSGTDLGSRPNAIWDITSINAMPSKEEIMAQGFNGVSIDIEAAWIELSYNYSPWNTKTVPQSWVNDHSGASLSRESPNVMWQLLGNYSMTNKESTQFANALNDKFATYKGLLRCIVLQGNGLSEQHGAMGWFTSVKPENYEYIIPMYYDQINDTGSKMGAGVSATDMPATIQNFWTTKMKVPPEKIILGYTLGNQANLGEAGGGGGGGGGGDTDTIKCKAYCPNSANDCRKQSDDINNWLSSKVLEKASAGVTNWAYYGGIIDWG